MPFPPAPAVDLDEGSDEHTAQEGWTLVDEREEIRVELPTSRVRSHTLVFDDATLRERVREATGIDHTWRFFFASPLAFEPPLPPLTGAATVYGPVRTGAREAFVDDLRNRGVDDIERGRTERLRTETGDRVSLTRYRGQSHLDANRAVPVAGLLGVWTHDGDFRLAGGWYPEQSLSVVLDGAPETDPSGFRTERIDLVRGTR